MARGRRTDDDEAIAGYGPEDAATALAPEPAAASEDDLMLANAAVRERESSKELDRQFTQHFADYEAFWMPWLTTEFGEDAAGRMWRGAIFPALRAGRDYARRERYRPRPVKAA